MIANARAGDLEIAPDKLVMAGAHIDVGSDGFRVMMEDRPKAVDVVTLLPYPGFPNRPAAAVHRPQFPIASGAAMVTENLFEARFRFVQELRGSGRTSVLMVITLWFEVVKAVRRTR